CAELAKEGVEIAHVHIRYMRPFPANLGDILKNYEHVLVPELNNGQLIKIIRDVYLIDAKGVNKIMGIPFTKAELIEAIKKLVQE
ncbi:MAG: 2-oxoglutarate ferredoxin oxidoreductase subunit alpha, partial [Ferruginibacter sp.]